MLILLVITAGANKILKGSNYYTIKNAQFDGINPERILSITPIDEKYKDDEQKKFILVKDQKNLNLWMGLGWFFICIPYIFITIAWIRLWFYYNKILKNNSSPATIWHDVKIKDARRKEGFYYSKELLVNNEYKRPLYEDEILVYEKLKKNSIILSIISGILILPLVYFIFFILL